MGEIMSCFARDSNNAPPFVHVGPPPKPQQPPRKQSHHIRRRVAIAAETSEMMAKLRWQSSFDWMRREESKTSEHVAHIRSILKAHDVFRTMDAGLLDDIIGAFRTVHVEAEETLIAQGDAGDAFYVIADGAFTVVRDGRAVTTYGPGDSFGEIALMYDCPRAATVKCKSEGARVYKLGRIAFRNLVSAQMQKQKAGLETMLSNAKQCACATPRQHPLPTPASHTHRHPLFLTHILPTSYTHTRITCTHARASMRQVHPCIQAYKHACQTCTKRARM
jgi:hypothetical protein